MVSAILVITRQQCRPQRDVSCRDVACGRGIFLTLHAEFLAGVQVIVYVGGILVLFVFVIMLIAVERAGHERQYNRQWTIALITSGILIVEIAYGLYRGKDSFLLPRRSGASGRRLSAETRNRSVSALYTAYLLPFEIASILLLVAIVGAVVLVEEEDTDGMRW